MDIWIGYGSAPFSSRYSHHCNTTRRALLEFGPTTSALGAMQMYMYNTQHAIHPHDLVTAIKHSMLFSQKWIASWRVSCN